MQDRRSYMSIITPPVIMAYAGLACMLMPYLIPFRTRLVEGLLNSLGLFLLITSVSLLFYRKTVERLELIMDRFWSSGRTGVIDAINLTAHRFDDACSHLLPSSKVDVLINASQLTKELVVFFEYLLRSSESTTQFRMLLATLTQDGRQQTIAQALSPRRTLVTDLMERVTVSNPTRLEVRSTETPTFQTTVISGSYSIVMLPRNAEGDDCLVLVVDHRSTMRHSYIDLFESLWTEAELVRTPASVA